MNPNHMSQLTEQKSYHVFIYSLYEICTAGGSNSAQTKQFWPKFSATE